MIGNQIGLLYLLTILFSGVLLGALIYNVIKGWRSWSGSWIMYLYIMVMIWLSQPLYKLTQSTTGNYGWVDTAQFFLAPLLMAYLLYKIACKDRLWGLLSAIPSMVIIWNLSFWLEFVPVQSKAIAHSWLYLLAFIAAVLMLRTKRLWAALSLATAVPILGGFPIAYLEIYGAGPQYFPRPSLPNVFSLYLPYLVLSLAIVLGPQLAVKLRSAGHEIVKAGGKGYYRLVLGGILCGLVYSLMHEVISTSEVNSLFIPMQVFLSTGIILFLVGYASLFYTVRKHKTPECDQGELVHLAVLFLPLLLLPVVIVMTLSSIGDAGSKSWAIWCLGIAWVTAAGLVVKA